MDSNSPGTPCEFRVHIPASKATLRRIAVAFLLVVQAALLGYSATQHSPTNLEPAFLASGICHWELGRFELYRVNPPLVRMVSAVPLLATGCKTDWSRFHDGPGSRAEFSVGEDFIKANGPMSIHLVIYARWACIPFSTIGAYVAYRWAKELYRSVSAGLLTLVLYVFEPNLLAHGELITPDSAATSFGILAGYLFWRWLKNPTWVGVAIAGGALGLAELTKMSWLILFGLWPILWAGWRLGKCQTSGALPPTTLSQSAFLYDGSTVQANEPPFVQLIAVLITAIYVVNLGYGFDGFGTRLKNFVFVSEALSGRNKASDPGNRFAMSCLGELPVPLPKQYVLGFDSQKRDLETFPSKSYLRGEWRHGGWWYYYIYGLLVKVPCGVLALFGLVVITRACLPQQAPLRDEMVVMLPATTLLVLVSSHTAFNIHLRYVFPCLGLCLVFIGQAATKSVLEHRCRWCHKIRLLAVVVIGCSLFACSSSLLQFPHLLAYFNEFAGGSNNGHRHLQGSSFDWGQDLLISSRICEKNEWTIIRIRPYQTVSQVEKELAPYCGIEPGDFRKLFSNTKPVAIVSASVFDEDSCPTDDILRISPTTYIVAE